MSLSSRDDPQDVWRDVPPSSPPVITSVRKYLYLAPVALAVWLTGYLGLSVVWVFAGLLAYILLERSLAAHNHSMAISQAMARDEKAAVMASFEQLPYWVQFPDVERVEFINKIIAQMWPSVTDNMEDIVRKKFEPTIREKLPAKMKSFKFTKVHMGSISPRIGGVKVYPRFRTNKIFLDVFLDFSSDCNIEFYMKGLTAGITDLKISGHLRVILKSSVKGWPFLAGVVVFFLKRPELNFNLAQHVKMFDIPLLKETLTSVILDKISEQMVLPNQFAVYVAKGEKLDYLQNREPQGVVRLTVVKAAKVKRMDGIRNRDKSDPYVILKVGIQQEKTSTIENADNPVWNETFDFFVYSAETQSVLLTMFDKDFATKDDFLGRAEVPLKKIMNKGYLDEWFQLEDIDTGTLNIKSRWLWLSKNPEELVENKKNNSAVLLVYLDSGARLPRQKDLREPSSHVNFKLGRTKVVSQTVPNCVDPKWQQVFRFFVWEPRHQTLEVELEDTDRIIGRTSIHLKNLLTEQDMEMDNSFPMTSSQPICSLFMRISLRILSSSKPEWMEDLELPNVDDTNNNNDVFL